MNTFFGEIVHDFNKDLEFEKSTRTPMDKFYREVWGVQDISVEDYNTETGRINQQKDRDVLVTSNSGRKVYVSEKYRKGAWDDILVEIFSVYPEKVGWSVHSEADIIAYVVPEKNTVTEIGVSTLVPVANQILRTLDSGLIERLIKSGERSTKIGLPLYGRNIRCRLICARNRGYNTISVAISKKDLQNMGVKMKDFPLNLTNINEEIEDFTKILE
jgi:hypothetical protein